MPIYIKYGGGPEGQGAFENTSLSIDADLLKLSNAVGDTFLTVEGAIKHDINVIGDTFIKWSNEFIKLSDVALKIDTFVIKLTQPTTTGDTALPAAAVEGGPQTDFINLDTSLKILGGDIKLLGSDFLKLDTAPDVAALKIAETAVGNAFSQAGADASNVSEAFIKLGNDLVGLGTGENANSLKLNEAYKIFGGDLVNKIAPAFQSVADGLQTLGEDFAALGGGSTDIGTTTVANVSPLDSKNATPGVVGTDLLKLEHDFLLLNQAIAGSAPEALKLVHAFIEQSGNSSSNGLAEHIQPVLGVQGASNSHHG